MPTFGPVDRVCQYLLDFFKLILSVVFAHFTAILTVDASFKNMAGPKGNSEF